MSFDTAGTNSIFSVLAAQQVLNEQAANTALSNGFNLMQKKKFDQAERAFKQATILKPDLAVGYTYQADALVRMGKKKEAAEVYKLSLKVDKTQDSVYTSLAGIYVDLDKKDEAQKVLKDGVKVNWQNTVAHYTLGHLQAQAGKFKDAEESFRKVVRLEPRDGNGYYGLGMALNGQGKFDEAITQLNRATTLKRDFSAAIAELGQSYFGKGDQEKVQQQIDRLIKIGKPDALMAADNLKNQITKPRISYYNASKSSLQLVLSPMSLYALDPLTFNTANASKQVTVKFVFNSEMDYKSVTDVTKWSITRASGREAGFYNNGLYDARNIPVPYMPSSVAYDPTRREATLTFPIKQNATNDGRIDTSRLVFKFMGVDARGVAMDESADEYDGFRNTPF